MRPEDILPDTVNSSEMNGVAVRKGTVAAFLVNARAYCAATTPQARAEAEALIVEYLPALDALGLFEVLAVRDDSLRALIARHRPG